MDNECFCVAMESTGVYWNAVYEAIEEYLPNYQCMMVVNASHMRNLPGRKSDVSDAEWISTLFRHGLLEPSFIPERLIRNLREYSRLHRSLVQECSRYSNRLEKLLQTHGFKLSSVLSNILSVSGRRILTILSQKGRLTFEDVLAAVDKNVKKSVEEIHPAICGKLDYAECKFLSMLLKKVECLDEEIAHIQAAMLELAAPYKIQIEQLDSIPGIDINAALAVIAEVSATPHNNFSDEKKLISWERLCRIPNGLLWRF